MHDPSSSGPEHAWSQHRGTGARYVARRISGDAMTLQPQTQYDTGDVARCLVAVVVDFARPERRDANGLPLVEYTRPRRRPIRGPEPLSPAIIFTYQSLKSNERFEANCLRRHGRTRGAQTEWQWPAWGAPQLPACAVRLLSTVCARRFCDQQEMSLHTATGRSLPYETWRMR